jgi:hypothetical protein
VRSPLAFFFPRSQKEQLVAQHIIREHHRGRSIQDIAKDAYVTNRLTPEQFNRVLERPEVVHAIGEDILAEFKATGVSPASGSDGPA